MENYGYDVFICYRGGSPESGVIGTKIYKDAAKYNVFYAPECLVKGENFKAVIPRLMDNVSIVILLLDREFFSGFGTPDNIVEYECREALKHPNIQFLPIYIDNFSFLNVDLSGFFTDEELDRIKHINGINYKGIYDFSVERDIIPALDSYFDGGSRAKKMSERSEERYYGASEEKEKGFLKIQQELLYRFDDDIYEKIMAGKNDLYVLDLGCNDGLQTARRFGSDERVARIAGIDIDPICIERAREKYRGEKYVFEVADIESDTLAERLDALTEAEGKKFDIINISMVILHLKRPTKLLRLVRKYLSRGGTLFIRDIDDGLNFAYPDTADGIFEEMTKMCEYCDILGYRKSGRQIYSYLKDAGFSAVALERAGLDTSGLTIDEKETLFEIYFGYIPTALRKTIDRTDLPRAKRDLRRVDDMLDDARDVFLQNNFIFSLGYMIYTARI